MSLHSFDTVLFEMPLSPIACTSSSTRRVETPPIPFAGGLGPVATRRLTLDHRDKRLFRSLPRL